MYTRACILFTCFDGGFYITTTKVNTTKIIFVDELGVNIYYNNQ